MICQTMSVTTSCAALHVADGSIVATLARSLNMNARCRIPWKIRYNRTTASLLLTRC